MIKVAQLTKYGQLAASTRQRFDQYYPYLQAAGIAVDPQPLFDDDYLQALYEENHRRPWQVMARYIQRLRWLMTNHDIEILWVHCEAFPYLPGIFEAMLHFPRKPIIFDFDDAIFHNYDLHRNLVIRAILGKKLKWTLSAAQTTFCGNRYLEEYAQRYAQDTMIVPTVVDTEIYTLRKTAEPHRVDHIGWIGTPSTWTEYMAPMMPLLVAVAAANNCRITAIGAGNAAPHPLLDNLPWTEQTEVARIQGMDIGVMPLTDTPWARGKCGYKLIQYMACGIPVVASPVGVNADIVEHGVNGFLATTDAEWREALTRLLADPALRQAMGTAGRRKVQERFSIQVWGPKIAAVIADIARKADR